MFVKHILLRLIIFTLLFTLIFYGIRYFNLLPPAKLYKNIDSIPWLFSAISLIFSIISGFVIQSKWHTWDELLDANQGELASLKQLHMLANHFSKIIQNKIRENICLYLKQIIDESHNNKNIYVRSEAVETAIYNLEETVLDIDYNEHPNIGVLAFDLVRKCLDYREKRLQNLAHKLPSGVKFFIICATFSMIFSSLFIGVNTLSYDYMFTLLIALLSYGIYLLIDDLDNPYSPGQWHLKIDMYEILYQEIQKNLREKI